MPWLAMKNQSVEAKHASKVSGVEVIPYLVILDNKGNIITKNGKKDDDEKSKIANKKEGDSIESVEGNNSKMEVDNEKNENNEIKLEAQKRINRDFSE